MNRTPLASRSTSHLHCGDRGAPAWVDLGTAAGTATAARFYCGLFGWSVVARHRPLEDSIGYWIFRQGGRDVGGLAPAEEATWTVYIAVADVDATARAVADNGGTVLVGPMAVDAGRMAVCEDPLGASFVVWQPDPDDAADDDGDQVGPCTSYQLACHDVEGAKRFYGAVFGWDASTTPLAGGSCYTEFLHSGTERRVAGMVEMDERQLGVPARWMFHLEVGNTDSTAARAAELGGRVSVAPFDLPNGGRLAVLNDPERAVFSVLQAA